MLHVILVGTVIWGLATQDLAAVWGKWVVFIVSPLFILTYESYYQIRITLRKERGETSL